jgi:hypothetical protein
MGRLVALALGWFWVAGPAGAEDLPEALRPGAEEQLPLRVRVLRHGPAFLAGDAAQPLRMSEDPEPIEPDSLVTLPALAPGNRRVAVLLGRGTSVRLIVHLPVELLARVALDGARVYSGAAEAGIAGAGFAELHSGLHLKSTTGKGPWLRVRHRDQDVELSGVVGRDQVGFTYDERPVFGEGGDGEVRAGARLLGRPGGPVLARLRGRRSKWLPATRLGAPERGYQRIRVSFPEIRIEAWARVSDVRATDAFGTGGSWASGRDSGLGARPRTKRIQLPRGTRLREGPGRPVIGLVAQESEHELVRHESGEPPVIRIHTDFGDADVVAEPP